MTLKEANERIKELEQENKEITTAALANAKAYHEANAQLSALRAQEADRQLASMQQEEDTATATVA